MSAGRYDIVMDQGSDFALAMTVKQDGAVYNLTNYLVRSQMRSSKTAASPSASFTGTVINALNGTLKIELSNAITKTLTPGVYYYDLEIYTIDSEGNDESVRRLLEGRVTVTAEITK